MHCSDILLLNLIQIWMQILDMMSSECDNLRIAT